MKKLLFVMTLAVIMLAFTGCFHKHTFSEANCTAPKTCTECGETEGSALGHSWEAATCTSPQTCVDCGKTEGAALGHSWSMATCTSPQTCADCGKTEGEALGHAWKAATCTTPKTCSRCSATSGNALGHSWKTATCTSPKTCSKCNATEGYAKGHSYSNGRCVTCYAADPNRKTPDQVFSAVKNYIQKYGNSTNAGKEYYINSNLAVVYRPETDSILFRYKNNVYGYTIFNTCLAIYNHSNEAEISLAIFGSKNYFTTDIEMKKTSITEHTQVNVTGASYYNQLYSQEATVGLREILSDVEYFLQKQGLSLNEWGFTNY